MDYVILGSGGGLGSLVAARLGARGHAVRAIPRGSSRDAAAIGRVAIGAAAIINCAGASVAFGFGRGWRGYGAVDVPIGTAAIAAARAAQVPLVYVGVHHDPAAAIARCAYVRAHERVATAMRDLPQSTVVRATGFYSAFAALSQMARGGRLYDIGDGSARTNPIDEHDLADIVTDAALDPARPTDIAAGGPDILTRAEIFELVAARARTDTGRARIEISRFPAWLARFGSLWFKLVHPRMGGFAEFASYLAHTDCVAPQLGTTRLADYLAAPAP